jgi:hypothetical protein
LISTDRRCEPGRCTSETSVISPLSTVISTWTLPQRFDSAGPVTVSVPDLDCPVVPLALSALLTGLLLPAVASVEGVLKLSSRASPQAVAVRAVAALRVRGCMTAPERA